MRLTELFNSAVRVEWHIVTPRVTIAPFECDGLQYVIRVEVLKLQGEIGYNVGFVRVNGKDHIQTITNDTKSVVRALSMIANAVAERVRDEGPSFVFVGAADNVDQRLRVYRNLVQMVVRKNPDPEVS